MTSTAFSDDDAHNAEPEHLNPHAEYLARLNERRRVMRESHDAVQALIDADRARRNH